MDIHYREAFVVTANGKRKIFNDLQSAAAAACAAATTAGKQALTTTEAADFNGSVSWEIEEVPATKLDELLAEYVDELHAEGGADGVDRDSPFLLVESNVHGGYWLSSGMSPEGLVAYHLEQEYAEDWEIEGIYDTATGEPVHGETTTTVSY